MAIVDNIVMHNEVQEDSTGFGPVDCTNCTQITVYVVVNGSGATGSVNVETAPYCDYSGTWYLLDTYTFDSGGMWYEQYYGPLGAIRVRIVDGDVTDGSVTASVIGI